MKVTLLCIGKTSSDFLRAGEREYLNRLQHYIKIERVELPDLKNAKSLSVEQIKQREGDLFLSRLTPTDKLILLDEKGEQYSSLDFSVFLAQKMRESRAIVFLIGGAYGFSQAVYARANDKLSLSKMTFSHQMIRMIFLEQLYRACTIERGEPYHHR